MTLLLSPHDLSELVRKGTPEELRARLDELGRGMTALRDERTLLRAELNRRALKYHLGSWVTEAPRVLEGTFVITKKGVDAVGRNAIWGHRILSELKPLSHLELKLWCEGDKPMRVVRTFRDAAEANRRMGWERWLTNLPHGKRVLEKRQAALRTLPDPNTTEGARERQRILDERKAAKLKPTNGEET